MTSPFAPASPSCYPPVSWEFTWVFEVLGNRYCFWCTEICQECMAGTKKEWLVFSCRLLMSVYQLRSCKRGGWAESLFVAEKGCSSERDFSCRKGSLTLSLVSWAAASCWAASLPGYTLVRSWDSLGLLSLWLSWARRGGFRITSLPHCSPEGSWQAFWRYPIFACVSFPVCFPLTGSVPLTADASVE